MAQHDVTALFDEALSLTHHVPLGASPTQRMQAEQYLLALRDSDAGLQLSFYLLASYHTDNNNNVNNNNNNSNNNSSSDSKSEVQLFWALNTIMHRLPQLADTLDAARAEELLQTLFAFVHRCYAVAADDGSGISNDKYNDRSGADSSSRSMHDEGRFVMTTTTTNMRPYNSNNNNNSDAVTTTSAARCVHDASGHVAFGSRRMDTHAVAAAATTLPAEYVLNKHAQLLVMGVQAFYPTRWCSFFDRLFALVDAYVTDNDNNNNNSNSSNGSSRVAGERDVSSAGARAVRDAATLYVLRVFDYMDEYVVATRERGDRDREQRTRDATIKDAMREAVLPRAVQLWHAILWRCHAYMTTQLASSSNGGNNNSGSNNDTRHGMRTSSSHRDTRASLAAASTARLCLSVVQTYVAWADVQLFVTDAWRQLLYALLDMPATRVAVCDVWLALVNKKQLPGWKLATLQALRVLDVLPHLVDLLGSMLCDGGDAVCASSLHDAFATGVSGDADVALLLQAHASAATLFVLRNNSNNNNTTTSSSSRHSSSRAADDERDDDDDVAFAEAIARLCTAVAEQLLQLLETMQQQQQQQQSSNNDVATTATEYAAAQTTRQDGVVSATSSPHLLRSSSLSNHSSHHSDNNNNNMSASGDGYVVQDMPYEVTPALLQSLADALHGTVALLLLRLLRIDSSEVRDAVLPFAQTYVKSSALRSDEAAALLHGLFAHTRVRGVCGDVNAAADEDVVLQRKLLYTLLRLLYRRQPSLVLTHVQQLVLYTTTRDRSRVACAHATAASSRRRACLDGGSASDAATNGSSNNNSNHTCDGDCTCDAADTEAVLRYLYELGEAIKMEVLRDTDHVVTQLLARVLMCDALATHACAAVHLAYVELLDRYSAFFVAHRACIAMLLQRLLLQPCGVVSTCARVRARVCCIVGHLLSVLKPCLQPYAADMIVALHSIVLSSSSSSSVRPDAAAQQQQTTSSLLPGDCRQLYEAIGILVRILLTSARQEEQQQQVDGSSSASRNGNTYSEHAPCDNDGSSGSGGDVCLRLLQDVLQSSMARLRRACDDGSSSSSSSTSVWQASRAQSGNMAMLPSPSSLPSPRSDEVVADAISYLTALLKGIGDLSSAVSSNNNNNNNSSAAVATSLTGSLVSASSQLPPWSSSVAGNEAATRNSNNNNNDTSPSRRVAHGDGSASVARRSCSRTTTHTRDDAATTTTMTGADAADADASQLLQWTIVQLLHRTTHDVMRVAELWAASSVVRDAVGQYFHQVVNTLPYDGVVDGDVAQYVTSTLRSMAAVVELSRLLRLCLQIVGRVGARASSLVTQATPLLWRKLCDAGAPLSQHASSLVCMGVVSESAREMIDVYRAFFAFLLSAASRGCGAALLCVEADCLQAVFQQVVGALAVPAELELPRLGLQLCTQLCLACGAATTTATATATTGSSATAERSSSSHGNNVVNKTNDNNNNNNNGDSRTSRSDGGGVSSEGTAASFLSFALHVVLRSALRVLLGAAVDLKDAKNALLVGDVAQLCKTLTLRLGDTALEALYGELAPYTGGEVAMQMCVTMRDAAQADGVVKAQLRRVLTAAAAAAAAAQQRYVQASQPSHNDNMTCDS